MRPLVLACAALFAAACGGSVISPSSSADGGTPDTEAPDAPSSDPPSTAACNHCVASTVAWTMSGGDVPASDTSALAPCRKYTHTRGTKSCGADLPGCEQRDDRLDILSVALARADVQQALAGGATLFGSDPRPCDGAVLEITVGARTISVGGDCAAQCIAGTPCTPVPEGLREVAGILQDIDAQMLATDACASLR